MGKWTLADIPDLSGKVFVVTGGNAGLGFKSVQELSKAGARVVLTCRNLEQGQQLAAQINLQLARNAVDAVQLDLINSDSIKACSQYITDNYQRLDGLINNAGVVNLEHLTRTPLGHEMHMATNHYGHFALTCQLFELLKNTPRSRVVTVSSGGYRAGEINFDDLDWTYRPYHRVKAYADSKLANVLFMRTLQTKFEQAGASCLSVAAHPGLTASERQQTIGVGGWLTKWLASPLSTGVAPQLMAATAIDADKRDFFGPSFGIWGAPSKQQLKRLAMDDELGEKLWRHSELVTGCHVG